MSEPKIKFRQYDKAAVLPRRGTSGSAGFDLTYTRKDVIRKGEYMLYFGLAVEIPLGWVGMLMPRSSTYTRYGVQFPFTGVIDSDYRGELRAVAVTTEHGQVPRPPACIAQLVITKFCGGADAYWHEALSPTARGTGGFGSTGTGVAMEPMKPEDARASALRAALAADRDCPE